MWIKNRKAKPNGSAFLWILFWWNGSCLHGTGNTHNGLVGCAAGSLLLDASLLTGESAQIVQLGATYLTTLVHLDAVDVGRLDGEDTLYTNGTGHLANGETLLFALATDFDNDTTIELDTLLVTFHNLVGYGNGVT